MTEAEKLAALDRAATEGVWSVTAYYTQSGTPDELCRGFIEANDSPTGVIDEEPAPVDDVLSHDLAFIVALVNAYRANQLVLIGPDAVEKMRGALGMALADMDPYTRLEELTREDETALARAALAALGVKP